EVWITAVGEHASIEPDVVLWFALEFIFSSGNIELWMFFNPGMVGGGVVRHEIEDQTHSALIDSAAQAVESCIATEIGMRGVAGDGKGRTCDVVRLKIRKDLAEFCEPLRILTRNFPRCSSRLPHTKEPEPVEAHIGQTIEFRIRKVVQCCGPTRPLG